MTHPRTMNTTTCTAPDLAGNQRDLSVGSRICVAQTFDSFISIPHRNAIGWVKEVGPGSITVAIGEDEHVLFPGLDKIYSLGTADDPVWPDIEVRTRSTNPFGIAADVRRELLRAGEDRWAEQVVKWAAGLSFDDGLNLMLSLAPIDFDTSGYDFEDDD